MRAPVELAVLAVTAGRKATVVPVASVVRVALVVLVVRVDAVGQADRPSATAEVAAPAVRAAFRRCWYQVAAAVPVVQVATRGPLAAAELVAPAVLVA